jgi:hypothetical protein
MNVIFAVRLLAGWTAKILMHNNLGFSGSERGIFGALN